MTAQHHVTTDQTVLLQTLLLLLVAAGVLRAARRRREALLRPFVSFLERHHLSHYTVRSRPAAMLHAAHTNAVAAPATLLLLLLLDQLQLP
jgi:hypothetical protein